jgi:tetratricopeptide (TPR) repeat protein
MSALSWNQPEKDSLEYHLKEARNQFFKEHNTQKAEAAIRRCLKTPFRNDEEKKMILELQALIYRNQLKFEDAIKTYEKLNDNYQAGYCALLKGDLKRIQKYWQPVIEKQPNHWCLTLYGLVTKQLQTCPTLLQVRHYLETDIETLIDARRSDYLENLLSYLDVLTQFNLETPKMMGRALMYSNHLDRAKSYLVRGQSVLPNDPEIYFHLGQYSVYQKQPAEARVLLGQCLLMNPHYRPASELLASIQE